MHTGLTLLLDVFNVASRNLVFWNKLLSKKRRACGEVTRLGDNIVVMLNYHKGSIYSLTEWSLWCTRIHVLALSASNFLVFETKKSKDGKKFYTDKVSIPVVWEAHGNSHAFVPFVIEDGGRLVAHAHAFPTRTGSHDSSCRTTQPHSSPWPNWEPNTWSECNSGLLMGTTLVAPYLVLDIPLLVALAH